MANALYDHGREGFLDGSIDWDTDDIRLYGVDEVDDTPNLATDEDKADRTAGAVVGLGASGMTSKTVTAGTADAADYTVSTVSGDQFASFDIFQHTGTDSTARLILNIDNATGLPFTPSGGDITYTWDSGADKIFTL